MKVVNAVKIKENQKLAILKLIAIQKGLHPHKIFLTHFSDSAKVGF